MKHMLPPLDGGDDDNAAAAGPDDLLAMLTDPAAGAMQSTGCGAHDSLMAMLLTEPSPDPDGGAAAEGTAGNVHHEVDPIFGSHGAPGVRHRRDGTDDEEEEGHGIRGDRTAGGNRNEAKNGKKEVPEAKGQADNKKMHVLAGDQLPLPFPLTGSIADIGTVHKKEKAGTENEDDVSGRKKEEAMTKSMPIVAAKPEISGGEEPPLPVPTRIDDVREEGAPEQGSKNEPAGSISTVCDDSKKEYEGAPHEKEEAKTKSTPMVAETPDVSGGDEPPLPVPTHIAGMREKRATKHESKSKPAQSTATGLDDSGRDHAASVSNVGLHTSPPGSEEGRGPTSKKPDTCTGRAQSISSLTASIRTVYTAEDIGKVLPHASPFIFVDKVIEYEAGKRAVGVKTVSSDEPFLAGHFPGRPIMPNVLQLEAFAQLAGMVLILDMDGSNPSVGSDRIPFLSEVRNVQWQRPVVPGDVMFIEIEVLNWNPMFNSACVAGRD